MNQQPTPEQKVMQAKFILWFGIIIIIVIGIAVAVYFIFMKTAGQGNVNVAKDINIAVSNTNVVSNINNNANVTINVNTPVNTTTQIDMSNWQAYENKDFGYSVKYPNDWNIKITDSHSVRIYCEAEWPDCAWSLTINTTNNSLESFIKDYNSGSQYTKIYKQEDNILNGYKGTKLYGSTDLGIDNIYIFINHNDSNYILNYSSVRQRADIGEKILSTFQFTK